MGVDSYAPYMPMVLRFFSSVYMRMWDVASIMEGMEARDYGRPVFSFCFLLWVLLFLVMFYLEVK